jgi:hypothetical protein
MVKPVLRFQMVLSECYAWHRFAGFTTFTGFFWRSGAAFPPGDGRKKAQMLEAKWADNLCILVVKFNELNQVS